MKTLITTLGIALISTAAIAGNGNGEGKSYTVNTEKSQIFWTGKKVTGEHTGTLSIKEGKVEIIDGAPVAASFDIDFNTIVCTDITDAGTNAKFVGHLKSDDFFSVEKFPYGKFEATSFAPIAGAKDREANYTITGNLTIKGITNEISFPAFISTKGDALVANGKVVFDRSKFDIRFGSSSFFEGLGDKVIYDDVELSFVLSAKG